MKRFLALLALVAVGLIGGSWFDGHTANAAWLRALVYPWQGGQPCTAAQQCKLHYQRLNTNISGSVGTAASSFYCGDHEFYYHFQYGYTYCDRIPFWENAWATVASGYYWSVWASQPCPGGGYRYSPSRVVLAPSGFEGDVYTGAHQPNSSCVALAKALSVHKLRNVVKSDRSPSDLREKLRRNCVPIDGTNLRKWACPEPHPA